MFHLRRFFSTFAPAAPAAVKRSIAAVRKAEASPPAWQVARDISLKLTSLPSAADVLLETRKSAAAMNIRNLVTALHTVSRKVWWLARTCRSGWQCHVVVVFVQLERNSASLRLTVLTSGDLKLLLRTIQVRLDGLTNPDHASVRVLASTAWAVSKLCVGIKDVADEFSSAPATPSSPPEASISAPGDLPAEAEQLMDTVATIMTAKLARPTAELPPIEVTRLLWGLAAFPSPRVKQV